ncbi:MAG TPA: hypothetical protein VL574_12575 [Stellaceae bacterium]|nr:hypothetical protein [Stellaceae bacterium]
MFGLLGVLAALMGFAVAAGVALVVLAILVSPLALLLLFIRASRSRAGGMGAGVRHSRVPIVLAGIATVICIIVVSQIGRHTHFSFQYFWQGLSHRPPATTSV